MVSSQEIGVVVLAEEDVADSAAVRTEPVTKLRAETLPPVERKSRFEKRHFYSAPKIVI